MEYGISDRVHLAGERPPQELADWYTACDLLLLCSTREGRPNVVLEALASGRNVLATDAGGTAEILPQPRMLAKDRDPEVLGAQLSALLAEPSSAQELAASVAHLSWSGSLETLEEWLGLDLSYQPAGPPLSVSPEAAFFGTPFDPTLDPVGIPGGR